MAQPIPFRLLCLFFGFALLVSSCGDKEDTPLPYEQEAILLPIGQEIAVAEHRNFRDQSIDLSTACQTFLNVKDSQSLSLLRQQFLATHLAWKSCEPFEFGQAKNTYLHNRIGKWPSNYNFIDWGISGNEAITAAAVDALGSSSKGLSAIEYLLFDQELTQTQQAFVSDSFAGRRGQLLDQLSLNLQQKADALYEFWQPGGSDFGELWPMSNETGIQSPLSLFVNRQIELIEEVTKLKLGTPLGKFDGGAPQPESLEAARSKRSLVLLRENLATIQRLCKGTAEDNGLYAALNALEAQYNGNPLAEAIEATFQNLIAGIDATSGPMVDVLNNDPNSLEPLYEEARKLTVLFKTDLASALSITVTVSDNDGD